MSIEPNLTDTTGTSEPAADVFGCALTSLTVGKGQPLPLHGQGGVVAIVGANNVGKSTLLGEIREFVSKVPGTRGPSSKVLTAAKFEWTGSVEAMGAWVVEHNKYHPAEARHVAADQLQQLKSSRNRDDTVPGGQWKWFVNEQTPLERGKVCDPVARLDSISERAKHPMHTLSTDEDSRTTVQSLAQKLFQQHLEIDNLSGKVGFVVGDPRVKAPPVNAVSKEYSAALGALPKLHEQGDGMRSALGLLIPLITDNYCISLIDEPEAFLHPPQARTLGIEVANLAVANRAQVILATHDKNFLQGLVESGAPVTIIHLSREGDDTRAQLLNPVEVRELWDDTVLRYGNALDGLFHSAVIVTEGDQDSQFYAAAIDHLLSQDDPPRVHNLMFLASYGKTNIAVIIERLRALGVRTVSTPDLDILNDKTVLKSLVEAHGGDWTNVESNYTKATNQFRQPTQYPTLADVRSGINAILDGATGGSLTDELVKQLRTVVSVKSPWAHLKKYGEAAFTAELAAKTALLDGLDALGIVTVRVGELERFLTTDNAAKGRGFLKVAFENDAHKSEDAQKHAVRLLTAAGQEVG